LVQRSALKQLVQFFEKSGFVPGQAAGKGQDIGTVIGPEHCSDKIKAQHQMQ